MIKKIWITGASGQLGRSLQYALGNRWPLILSDIAADGEVKELDICNPESVQRLLEEQKPTVIINCAAFTDVNGAQVEPDKAFRVNDLAPRILAREAKNTGVLLVHISTDFVFSGHTDRPYQENDVAMPLSVYGRSKLDGENAIRESDCLHYILRTAWLYSRYGRNFVKTMIDLSYKVEEIPVVADQIGSPTHALDLAYAIKDFLNLWDADCPVPCGTYHYANFGQCSWFDLATEALRLFGSRVKIVPQTTAQYVAKFKEGKSFDPAPRPVYSVLDCEKFETAFSGHSLRPWRQSLDRCIQAIEQDQRT